MFGSFRDADISPVASRPPGLFCFLRNLGRYPASGFSVAQAGLHATTLRSAILTGRIRSSGRTGSCFNRRPGPAIGLAGDVSPLRQAAGMSRSCGDHDDLDTSRVDVVLHGPHELTLKLRRLQMPETIYRRKHHG